jgi:hypothetical protein
MKVFLAINLFAQSRCAHVNCRSSDVTPFGVTHLDSQALHVVFILMRIDTFNFHEVTNRNLVSSEYRTRRGTD